MATAAPSPQTTPTPEPSPTPDDPPKKPKRGTFIFAPIPISSPTFGSGLILGGSYVFKFRMDDEKSPPSTIGIATAAPLFPLALTVISLEELLKRLIKILL
jgi:hypothetical protein